MGAKRVAEHARRREPRPGRWCGQAALLDYLMPGLPQVGLQLSFSGRAAGLYVGEPEALLLAVEAAAPAAPVPIPVPAAVATRTATTAPSGAGTDLSVPTEERRHA